MKAGCLIIKSGMTALLIAVLCASAYGAQVIKGTLLSSPIATGLVRVQTESGTLAVCPSDNIKIMRGQAGKQLREALLSELAPGDWVVALLDSNDLAVSLKAYYDIARGKVEKTGKGILTLKDVGNIPLSPTPQVILPTGKPGRIADIVAGAEVVCRTNPITKQAWTIAATYLPESKPVIPANTKRTSPSSADSRPKITAIRYTAPDLIRPGDTITISLEGSPKGQASFGVKGLISGKMSEVSPGSYLATVRVPKDKIVHDAALIGHLTIGKIEAAPVQASRLLTIDDGTSKPKLPPLAFTDPAPQPKVPEQKPIEKTPVAPTPGSTETIKPVQPAIPAAPATPSKIALILPPDGARIMRSILVKGNAEPEARVQIEITYNNGLSGILRLAGKVASESLAVGKNGMFVMGPIGLEGPLATKGLRFTIKAYYPDRQEHNTAEVTVFGDRE